MMDKKEQAMKEIQECRARLSELERIVQEPEHKGLWKPGEDGVHFWVSGTSGSVGRKDYHENQAFDVGNCFPTRQAAEKAVTLFSRAHKIIAAALQVDPDAGLGHRYTVYREDMGWTWWDTHVYEPFRGQAIVTVHTREQAERVADILNAEGIE